VHASNFLASETLSSGNIIYDSPSSGLSRTLNISDFGDSISDLSVTLNIGSAPGDTAWNSDLYVQLTSPQGRVAVLLNQPGITSSDLVGYGDAGLNLTIHDTSSHDIHNYQTFSYSLNGNGQLTGAWQSDGRLDPTSLSRTSQLGNLAGENPNGDWVLLIADRGNGNLAQLNGWGISGSAITAVPEPATITCWTALALAGFGFIRRSRRSAV
jgi:subtilisin-like proprotein convertase family protein